MRRKNVALLAGPLLGLLVAFVLRQNGYSPPLSWTAGITTWVALWWVLEPISIPATSLIPFAVFPLVGVLTHAEVARAYGHTLILLLMAGFILSSAMERSGAHRRLALTLVRVVGGGSGRRIVLGFMLAAAVLSMWISNSATSLTHAEVARAYGHTLILLLMAGFILSSAMERSGAHRRLALTLVRVVGGGSGRRIVLGFMLAAAVLSMWISNSATSLMLLPVAMAILEQTKERKKLAVPLLLGLAYGANIGGIGTPIGTPPNVIFMALYRNTTGEEWTFLQWMMIGVPVVALLLPVAWLWITRGLHLKEQLTIPDPGAWRPEERRVLIVFAIAALLWIFRTEPLGGWNGQIERLWNFVPKQRETLVGDSTVALLVAVIMFIVPNGRGGQLLDWKTAKRLPWGLLLLFGGGLAIGMAFQASGLSKEIGSLLSGVVTWNLLAVIAVVCLTVTFLTEVTSNTATTNILLPILAAASMGSGGAIPPECLMVPAAISASCAFMLPVATVPNAVVFGTDYITTSRMVREGFALNLFGAVIITLICYFCLR